MTTKAINVQRVQLSDVKPAPYNPRVELRPGDPAFESLARSIETFDLVQPIVWNKRTGHAVGGNQRLAVLQARGDLETDVVVVDLPLAEEKVLNLALNRIDGDWDTDKLARMLDDLVQQSELDVELSGFNLSDIQVLIEDVLKPVQHGQPESFDVEGEGGRERAVVTQRGDLIELGAHRLLCGDCTDPDQVRRLMCDQRAVLFHTDPPYLVGYDGTNHPGRAGNGSTKTHETLRRSDAATNKLHRRQRRAAKEAKNKNWSESYAVNWDDAEVNGDLYEKLIATAIAEAIMPKAAWYCWHASRNQAMLERIWNEHGAFVHQQIIWAKDRPILTFSWYTWQHEPCFFGWVKGDKPKRISSDYPSTIWQVPTVPAGTKTEHPTSKPTELFEITMRQHTVAGDICYEPFAGSGSQIIAAARLGRRCFACEISPRYCDLCVRRYIALVGADNVSSELVDRYRIIDQEVPDDC